MAWKGQRHARFTEDQKTALSALKKYSDMKETVSEAWKMRDEAEHAAVSALKDYKSASYKLVDEAAAIIRNFDNLVVKPKRDLAMVADLIKHGYAGKVGIVGKPSGRFYTLVSSKLGSHRGVQVYSIT